MARYGVIADIHGNREALVAALDALAAREIRHLVCLGDIVGYNADADECAALVRERRAVAIAGNHDLIAIRRLGFSRCSNNAAYALRRTRRTLAPESAVYLAGLPAHHVLEPGIVLVHGGVRDVQQYMTTPAHIAQNAAWLREDFPGARACFFGHSHEQKVYEVLENSVREVSPGELSRKSLYFINPGSIDASRKRSHKLAEFAVFDSIAMSIEFLRVPYYAPATEAKAAALGYRIPPWMDGVYSLRRRLSHNWRAISSAATRWPSTFRRVLK
jgi:predicted phosphodiesterase